MNRIFLVGCSRSGTTLLQSILAAHPQFYSLPETAFFQQLAGDSEKRMFGSMARSRPKTFRSFLVAVRSALQLTGPKFYRIESNQLKDLPSIPADGLFPRGMLRYSKASEIFYVHLDRLAKASGCSGWVEKTPNHVHYLREIERYVPNSWVVHILRDGFAVCASIYSAGLKHPESHWGQLYDKLPRIVARWNKAVNDSRLYLQHDRHIFVSYEKLVDEPARVIRSLGKRLSLPFCPDEMLSKRSSIIGKIVTSKETWKNGVANTIKKSKNQFHIVFSEEQQAYIRNHLVKLTPFEEVFL
jgi:hypothetical protein